MPIDLTKPLDLTTLTPEEELMLNDLQGNILKSHGRPHSIHVLLRFSGNQADARAYVRALSAEVKTARQQLDDRMRPKDAMQVNTGRLFVTFFISAAGYHAIGRDNAMPQEVGFRHGMKARARQLGDSVDRTGWEDGFGGDVHAMLLIADDSPAQVEEARKRLLALGAGAVEEIGHICGHRLQRNGVTVEHFGYADGLSGPKFFLDGAGAAEKWSRVAPVGAVLTPCPGDEKGLSFGSYVVVRKLEQNVRGFWAGVRAVSPQLRQSEALTGAWLFGRFQDGTPVVTQPSDGDRTNDFDYQDDPDGLRCPTHAHIRKVNPRSLGAVQIARRGVTYGARTDDLSAPADLDLLPVKGVGLLFISYQARIAGQFEVLQAWANTADHPRDGAGLDPIVAQPDGAGPIDLRFPPAWGQGGPGASVPFGRYVTLKGGEYFFAPSLSFLRTA